MNPRYKKYLNDSGVFEAVRVDRYCIFTNSILTAAEAAACLNNRKKLKPRGSVTIKGKKIEYTMVSTDINGD